MDSKFGWKLEFVGELSTKMVVPQCAVMNKKIYLCFWTDTDLPINRSYQKCVSARGPLKVFTDIGTSSLYPHRAISQQLASNDRKCILKNNTKIYLCIKSTCSPSVMGKGNIKCLRIRMQKLKC